MQGNARKRYLTLRQTDDDDQALFRTLNPQDSCFAAAEVLRASVRHTDARFEHRLVQNYRSSIDVGDEAAILTRKKSSTQTVHLLSFEAI